MAIWFKAEWRAAHEGKRFEKEKLIKEVLYNANISIGQ